MSHKIVSYNQKKNKHICQPDTDIHIDHKTGNIQCTPHSSKSKCCVNDIDWRLYEALMEQARKEKEAAEIVRNTLIEKINILPTLATKQDVTNAKTDIIAAMPKETSVAEIDGLF